jgi:hypothetical protein
MRRLVSYFVVWFALLGTSGCLRKQFVHDGIAIHKATVQLYTDQAMSNLIRAKCNVPFVQLSYSKISLTDKVFGRGTAGTDQTVNTARDLFAASATRTLTNLYSLRGEFEDTRIMAFTADPVLNQQDTYARYVSFANDPATFCVSDRPPQEKVHLMREYDHKYYYVPLEAGPAFFDLVMQTAIMRGGVAPALVAEAYDRMIDDVIDINHPKGREFFNATAVLSDVVPNGEGLLVVNLRDGRRVKIEATSFGNLDVGQATKKIAIQWPGVTVNDMKDLKELRGLRGRFHSDDNPPEKWLKAPPRAK